MEKGISYQFSATMWQHSSPGGWYFVSLPADLSTEIRNHLKWQEEGWGRMKAIAEIGQQKWKTSIWYDTKIGSYILPIKSEIRSREKLMTDSPIEVKIII